MERSFFHQHLQFSRSFTKKLNEQLAEVGLYHSQWLLIYYLKEFETATLVDISNYLDVEKPTITRTVNRLEERGLIRKVPSKDRRERRIGLTEKGNEVYGEAGKVVKSFEQSLMEGMQETEIVSTIRTIQLLKKKLN
ncbi:MarR family winged helix-turn-helix transcriptional regulator [Oceanobacillus halophilus]|nr:MarR family transcriptional regulator [Oceanobacillus halophilus]